MISSENLALNDLAVDADFTEQSYRELLLLAKSNYVFSRYNDIPWGERFILWRHDLDFSLNRALALALIEFDVGVNSTFFINLHSEYYNPLELNQYEIVQKILALGHDIGLHFDGAFHAIACEDDLDRLIANEAQIIETLFGVKPTVFSFHNPVASHLNCEAPSYGGLLNCYSLQFKKEVPYCSDSNGYWRFRRLYDVLNDATDNCLQVLTHPGWWQKEPMAPRARIFRSIFGRAQAIINQYDIGMKAHARVNHLGKLGGGQFLQDFQPDAFELIDYLWNKKKFQTLFVELWRLHKLQVKQLCEVFLKTNFFAPGEELNKLLFEELSFDDLHVFNAVFEMRLTCALGISDEEYQKLVDVRSHLLGGVRSNSDLEFEPECLLLCQLIQTLAVWGEQKDISYSGLGETSSLVSSTEEGQGACWMSFLQKIKSFEK